MNVCTYIHTYLRQRKKALPGVGTGYQVVVCMVNTIFLNGSVCMYVCTYIPTHIHTHIHACIEYINLWLVQVERFQPFWNSREENASSGNPVVKLRQEGIYVLYLC
jgi:hypothetical protein